MKRKYKCPLNTHPQYEFKLKVTDLFIIYWIGKNPKD